MNATEIRTIIRNAAGERDCKYRITSADEVHFYGRMPNTNQDGWYFVGFGAEDTAKQFAAGER